MADDEDTLIEEIASKAHAYLTHEAKPIHHFGHLEPLPLDKIDEWRGLDKHRPVGEKKPEKKKPQTKKFLCSGC